MLAGSREHHDDAALHERASELAGRIDAPGARATRQIDSRINQTTTCRWAENACEALPIVSHLSAELWLRD